MRSLLSRIHASPVEAVLLMIFKGLKRCLRCRIRALSVQAVLLMISETTATQFSLMIFETLRAVCGVKSIGHP
jgi:uncharacterized membrane protein